MAGGKEEEFDVLTFFIYVMILLTVFVGGFALLNYRKVSKESQKIQTEVRLLAEMTKLAMDEEVRGFVARDRELRATQAGGIPSLANFRQIYTNEARRRGLQIENDAQEGVINLRNGEEYPFRLSIRQCRVRDLVDFMAEIERRVPGARIKQVVKLDYNEREEANRTWDAVVILALFKPAEE